MGTDKVKKFLLIPGGLLGAAIVPAAILSGWNYWKGPAEANARLPAAAVGAADPSALAISTAVLPAADPGRAMSLEGPPLRDLADVLRFDVTPDWILQRWPRVSTGLAQIQLQGYRVLLVTGTAKSDLAGALTYYFNAHQQVQRVTFRGTTGDARNLITLLSKQFRFSRRLVNDPSLLVYESLQPSGKPAGALRVRSAPVVKASDPYHRFDVELVLERPEG